MCACLVIGTVTHAAVTQVRGYIDEIRTVGETTTPVQKLLIGGWAFDAAHPDLQSRIRITTDLEGTQIVDEIETWRIRHDVEQAMDGAGPRTGFHWIAPPQFYDGGFHKLYVWAQGLTDWKLIGDAVVSDVDGGVAGNVDAVTGNHFVGWAADLDGVSVSEQQVPVLVYIDGDFARAYIADMPRPDLAGAYPEWWMGIDHGFSFQLDVPRRFHDESVHLFEVFAVEHSEGVISRLPGSRQMYVDADGIMWPPYDVGHPITPEPIIAFPVDQTTYSPIEFQQ